MARRITVSENDVDVVRSWHLFDAEWYTGEYADVAKLEMDPAYHYLWLGARMGRLPSKGFEGWHRSDLTPSEIIAEIDGYGVDELLRHVGPAEFIAPARAHEAVLPGIRVAIHAHMYYADLAEEFADYLSRVPFAFDLFVSVPNEDAMQSVRRNFEKIKNMNKLDIRVVPNIGRDIAPFLVEFSQELPKYDVVSHIQTKKSLYNAGATLGWREYTLDALFGEPHRICAYVNHLASGKYGIIYPQGFYNLPYMAYTWLANSGLARAWAPRFGVKRLPEGYFDFPTASMFWARTDAVRPLLEAKLQWSDFPKEQGQTDGTLAHCVERMLGVVPTAHGFRHGVIRDNNARSWSRWRMNQFINRPIAHVHDAITNSETRVVAFDIFDTLLTRPLLDADHVKHLLDAEHAAELRPGFRAARVHCEGVAREQKGRDVDIHDIYAQLPEQFGRDAEAATREIELEILSVRPRQEGIELFDFARSSGKKVILASDMFLPRSAIEEMLQRCGVSGWDEFYLSSDIGHRKDSGKLYTHILETEKIGPINMVMVGDNERSDFQIPSDMGIRTVHLVKAQNIMRAMPRWEGIVPDADLAGPGDQYLFGAIASEIFGRITYPDFSPRDMFGGDAHAIGYGVLGPIVVCFAKWLSDQAAEHRLDRLFFLSREGKFLKRVFDLWQEARPAVSTEYLIVSRRSVTVPCCQSVGDIFSIAASNAFFGAPMDVFMSERFGVTITDETWSRCEAQGIWSRDEPVHISDGYIDHLKPFLRFIADDIYAQADFERQGALGYLRSMGLASGDRSAVVDVGYGATIQRHLMRLLDAPVNGLYMMTDRRGAAFGPMQGVLSGGCFIDGSKDELSSPIFLNSFILEKMLSADDEQVVRYPGGKPEHRGEHAYVLQGRTAREGLQGGAMAFARDAIRFRDEMLPSLEIPKTSCATIFARFARNLSDREQAVLSSIPLDDFYCGRGVVT